MAEKDKAARKVPQMAQQAKKKNIYKYKAKKDSGFTDKQVSMQKDIKEKLTSQRPKKFKADKHGRFRGKVYDASPKILSEAGMTGSGKSTGMPNYSMMTTSSKGKTKLNYVKPYGGAIETGFKGYDERTPGQGLKSGGRAEYRMGGKCKLAKKGKGRAYGKNS